MENIDTGNNSYRFILEKHLMYICIYIALFSYTGPGCMDQTPPPPPPDMVMSACMTPWYHESHARCHDLATKPVHTCIIDMYILYVCMYVCMYVLYRMIY